MSLFFLIIMTQPAAHTPVPPSTPATTRPDERALRDASFECQRSMREQRGEYEPNDICICNRIVGLPETPSCRPAPQ